MKESSKHVLAAKRALLELVALLRHTRERLRLVAASLPEPSDDAVELLAAPDEGAMVRSIAEMVLGELLPLSETLRTAAEWDNEDLAVAWREGIARLDESEPDPPAAPAEVQPEERPDEQTLRYRRVMEVGRLLARLGKRRRSNWLKVLARKSKEKKR